MDISAVGIRTLISVLVRHFLRARRHGPPRAAPCWSPPQHITLLAGTMLYSFGPAIPRLATALGPLPPPILPLPRAALLRTPDRGKPMSPAVPLFPRYSRATVTLAASLIVPPSHLARLQLFHVAAPKSSTH
ncbi:hypothetical protein K523DRAFT_90951 [Schizophyllum commune Tattone D]|nr:hypothetical protein K523DRAFT_90951 [Schizophyllum commune Tattone D]